jgi:hypothetical protein
MRRALCALLALSTLLAGCSMPLDRGGDGGVSVTPAPVTDAESVDKVPVTTTSERVGTPDPPDGGEFAELLDAHERRLSNVSYAYRIRIRSLPDGEGDLNTSISGYRGVDETVYYNQHFSEDFRWRTWANGSVQVQARFDRNETSYEVVEPPRPSAGPGRSTPRLRRLLAFARPISSSRNDTHYRIRAELGPRGGESLLGPEATIRNSSVSLTVRRGGLIEAYRVEVRGVAGNGDRIHIVERFSLDRSADTLPRPDWVNEALASGDST